MLAPKRVKWRKPMKGLIKGKERRGIRVAFGDWGLQALEGGWVTAQQLEAGRISMSRQMKRGGKIWIRVFPQVAFTKKPAETRMGSGKGAPEGWVAVVKPGKIIFEIAGTEEDVAKEALRLASNKLGIKTQIISKDMLRGI